MEKRGSVKNSVKGLKESYTFLAVLALISGYVIFQVFITPPNVGVIRISGSILGSKEVKDVLGMLTYAGGSDDIDAVVLEINSPGAEASVAEEIYMQVLQLRDKKPVVASIDQVGASGGYYIATAANYIFAKPSSSVGSIGVRASLPTAEELDESRIASGPFKETGSSRKQHMYELEMVKEIFLEEVIAQRGDKLKLDKEELSKAKVYLGIEALDIGLIDEIGSRRDAIEKAAKLAGIYNYGVVDINDELNITAPRAHLLVNESSLTSTNTVPAYYYIYREVE